MNRAIGISRANLRESQKYSTVVARIREEIKPVVQEKKIEEVEKAKKKVEKVDKVEKKSRSGKSS